MKSPWWIELLRFVVIVVPITLLGFVYSSVLQMFLLGLALYTGFQLLQLHRFYRWYMSRGRLDASHLNGVWGRLVNATEQITKKSVKRKQRVQKLIKELSSFRKALPDATVLLNQQNEISWCNSMAAHSLGIDRKKDKGRQISDIICIPKFISYLEQEEFEDPLMINAPGNESMRLHIQIAGYGGGNKVLSARDMTRMYRLEAMRRDFVGNVSHELRTPLTVIQGYTELLAEDVELTPEKRDIMGRIHQQSERMKTMVEDLLVLNRLETTGPSATSQMRVDVGVMSEAMVNEVRMTPKPKKRIIEVEIDCESALIGEPNELRSAFANLLSNAIRYTREGDSIHLKWYEEDKGACFEIEDSGEGIAEEHIPRLTQRFYRVQEDRSRATGGTGLGLAIVKHVLERHEAKLHIESEQGVGSRFICQFPEHRLTSI